MQEPHFSHNKAQTNMKMITNMVDILRHYCVCLWCVCNFLLAKINLVRIQGRGSRGKQRKHREVATVGTKAKMQTFANDCKLE